MRRKSKETVRKPKEDEILKRHKEFLLKWTDLVAFVWSDLQHKEPLHSAKTILMPNLVNGEEENSSKCWKWLLPIQ